MSPVPVAVVFRAGTAISLTLSETYVAQEPRDENGIVIRQQRHTRFIFPLFHPRGCNPDVLRLSVCVLRGAVTVGYKTILGCIFVQQIYQKNTRNAKVVVLN